MSPLPDVPLWIKHALRLVTLAGLLFIAWNVQHYIGIQHRLHGLTSSPLTYTSGSYGSKDGGIWLALATSFPDDVTLAAEASTIADDGHRYAWRTFVTNGKDARDRRFWVQPPVQLAPFANVIDLRITAYLQGYPKELPTLRLNLKEQP